MKRVEVDGEEWKEHGHVLDGKPSEKITSQDLRTEDFKRVAGRYRASTGVGADGFHPKVLLDFSAEVCVGKKQLGMFFTGQGEVYVQCGTGTVEFTTDGP